MASEEASQLVILGNGFDLKLGLKTKFEDYLGTFLTDKRVKKLDELFSNLSSYIHLQIMYDIKNENINMLHNQNNINNTVNSIKQKVNMEYGTNPQSSLLEFYIKFQFNKIRILVKEHIRTLEAGNLSERYLKAITKFENMFSFEKEGNNVTFWDIYLLYLCYSNQSEKDLNWSDIETQILTFYKRSNNESAKYNKLISLEDKNLFIIFRTLTDSKVSLNDIDEYLYQELIRFSQNFVDYLKSQYSQCYYGRNDYKLNSRWKFIDEKIADSEKYELLNFDYTNAEGYGCIKQIHIHGNKDKHNEIPIIGINAEDLTSNKEHAFKLTKQYQLISSENNKIEKLDLENIKRIVFYGHSLALADYQYFRNIFDRINLAESSVQLVFKYSKGYENYDSIFRLLDRYSKDVGVDIVTTLMLENRLKTEKI